MDEMIRKKLHRREHASTWRFLTCSCNHRLPFFDAGWINNLFVAHLAASQRRHSFRLLAWVLMPEHFHLMLSPTPDAEVDDVPVSRILHGLKTPFSQAVTRQWTKSGDPRIEHIRAPDGTRQFWLPGGGFDRNVRDLEELQREVRYIHHNPVKRGLVSHPTDWEWSSARWWSGQTDDRVKMFRSGGPKDWAL